MHKDIQIQKFYYVNPSGTIIVFVKRTGLLCLKRDHAFNELDRAFRLLQHLFCISI